MIAVATIDAELERLSARVRVLGLEIVAVHAPTHTRRVVLAAGAEEHDAEHVAALLRSEGELAVTRPEGGARLRAWQRANEPVTFGDRLTVATAWSEHDRHGSPGLVELGPGGFGSGHHPTTRMILEVLAETVRGGERLLDVGCGSGVLALGGLELGASRAVAVDRKPEAVEAAARNADLNQLVGLEATQAPLDRLDGTFEIVVANIARAGIVDLAPALVARVAPGGWLAVSGISPSQCELVAGFLRPLVLVDERVDGDWAMAVFAAETPFGSTHAQKGPRYPSFR